MDNSVIIGKVLKPRGLSGELKVQILTNKPEVFYTLNNKTIDNIGKVIKGSVQNGFAYLMLEGISTIEAADRFRGKEIRIPLAELSIDDDEIFTADLVGFAVVDASGKPLGKVKSIEFYGASEVIECVGTPGSDRGYFSFPYEDAFVIETNMTTKQIVIKAEMLEEEVIL